MATNLAAELGKSWDGVSLWYRREAVRRGEDPEFAAAAEALDQAAGEAPRNDTNPQIGAWHGYALPSTR